MKKCNFENLIDDYLFGRLDEKQKDKFEEHYFNCTHCFEKMEQTDTMIAVIKSKGSEIFHDVYAPRETKSSRMEHVLAFLTPRQWALAAVSAALILVVAIGIIPNLRTSSPEFFINDDLVRGSSITLISPVIDNLDQVPSEFKWQSLGDDLEYRLFIFHEEELLWSTETKDNYVTLSEEVKSLMAPAKRYSWQVKAFSSEGTLVAVSSCVQFNFNAPK